MENYPISINANNAIHHFEIGEYLHHDNERCKYRVFESGVMVASFEPDTHQYLHICQNPGKIAEELLNLLAEKIEAHHPHGNNNHLKS